MFVVIFGRPGCPFCVRAKDLADKLKEKRKLRRIFPVFQVNSISEYKIISHLERESCC